MQLRRFHYRTLLKLVVTIKSKTIFLSITYTFSSLFSKVYGSKTDSSSLTANPTKLLSSASKFFLYSGSLTTPPCTEGVNWYVLQKTIEITSAKALYSSNSRAAQALNGRQVLAK